MATLATQSSRHAAAYGGIIAGLSFTTFEIAASAYAGAPGTATTPLRMVGATVLGRHALAPTYPPLPVSAIGFAIVMTFAVACRYGGDEFVIAVPDMRLDAAVRIANDLREAVESSAPLLANVQCPPGVLSISVGVECGPFDGPIAPSVTDDTVTEQMCRAADAALYRAKNGGRNSVAIANAAC